eukprot:335519_1
MRVSSRISKVLPRSLVSCCQGHTSHDLAEYYSKQPLCKALIKAAWNALRKTTDHNHWLDIISFLHYLEKNSSIHLEDNVIPLIDPFKDVKYDLEELHRQSKAKYDKKKNHNKEDTQQDETLSYDERQE